MPPAKDRNAMGLSDLSGSSKLNLSHRPYFHGVTNLRIETTNHGRQLRGSPSIGHSLLAGVNAQTAVKTLSGWSGEIRGEIAVKLSLAALPLRTRLSFEIFGFCEAQSDAHSELTPNFAAQAADKIETCSPT
ncbi:hypothetical protein [Lapidilactobacillus salsurivasis]